MHAVDRNRFRYSRGFQDGWRDIDHVMELRANFAPRLDSFRPVDDGAVACAAKMRSDLFGPLVRSIHGVSPTDGIVVVGFGPAKLVDPRGKVFRSLKGLQAVKVAHLIETPIEGTFGGGSVVSNDVVDERIVHDAQFGDAVDHPADMVVGEFQKSGIDFHLPTEYRLECFRHLFPAGISLWRGVSGQSAGITPSFF